MYLLRAVVAITCTIGFGTIGFMFVESWGFWRSLFFTLVTITTVGYGDYGLSEIGERFTALLLLGGIGMATYSMSQIIQSILEYRLAWRKRMQRKIKKMSDHFIVCGLGRIGQSICRRLQEAGKEFVAIEQDEDLVEEFIEEGLTAIVGDASEDDVLRDVGIERARCIACVTNSDADNIVITLGARDLNPEIYIISRAEQDHAARKIIRAGATQAISPLRSCATSIADSMLHPELAMLFDESRGDRAGFRLADILIEPNSPLDGQTARNYGTANASLVFVALRRQGTDDQTRYRPRADDEFGAGDILIVAGETMDVARACQDGRSPARAAA